MGKNKSLWRDSYVKFIISFIGIYLGLYFFNIIYIGITSKGGIYIPFLDENINYIKWWRTFSIESSAKILRWMGHTVLTGSTQLKVVDRFGFTLIYSCLGYGIMSAFTAFCISFPSPFKYRWGFMVTGLVFIQLLNTIRFVFLSLYWDKHNPLLPIDHHDLFNIFIYMILIAICYFWIKYSTYSENAQNQA